MGRISEPLAVQFEPRKSTGKHRAAAVTFRVRQHYISGDITTNWPQVIVEIGTSQSRGSLERDVTYWAKEGSPDERILITIQILKDRVVLASWLRDIQAGCRLDEKLIAVNDKDRYHSENIMDAIVFPMADILLRPPGMGETKEIVTTNDDLLKIVAAVN